MKKIYEYDLYGDRYFVISVNRKLEHYSFRNGFTFKIKDDDPFSGRTTYLVDLKEKKVYRCVTVKIEDFQNYINYDNFGYLHHPVMRLEVKTLANQNYKAYGGMFRGVRPITRLYAHVHFFEGKHVHRIIVASYISSSIPV